MPRIRIGLPKWPAALIRAGIEEMYAQQGRAFRGLGLVFGEGKHRSAAASVSVRGGLRGQ